MNAWVAGVDGCRAGWVMVLREVSSGRLLARLVPRFTEVLRQPEAPSVIGVDIPIGLEAFAVRGGRACEVEARRLLGARKSSIFSSPSRPALESFRAGAGHAEVSSVNRGPTGSGPGLSLQTFNILSKVAEVDAALADPLPGAVHEVHPELSFLEASDSRPLRHSKKSARGSGERVALLESVGFARPHALLGPRRPPGAAADDLLDACIACWTAARIAAGSARVIPEHAPRDATGRRMEIWR